MSEETRLSRRQIDILFRLYASQTEVKGKFAPVLVADLAAFYGESYKDFANYLNQPPMPKCITTCHLFTDPDKYSVLLSEYGAACVERIQDERRHRRTDTRRFIIGLLAGWLLSWLGSPKEVLQLLSRLFP